MPRVEGFAHSLAVLVAIDDYENGVPELRTPVSDANELAKILNQHHGFEAEVWPNEKATLSGLRGLLATLAERVGSEDRVVFYFAGHGIALSSDDGPKGFILPQDAKQHSSDTYLPMIELHEALSALPCRHMLVILDCCFAGAFRWGSFRHVALAPENLHEERYNWFIHDAAWQAIASAAHDQKALDVASEQTLGKRNEAGDLHSPFAAALITGLRGDADLTPGGGRPDGVITATELYLYLESKLLPSGSYDPRRQRPAFWPLRKHDKGQFVFLAPGSQLSLPPAPPLTRKSDPWRSLEPYDETDKELFFGRDKAADELAAKVRKEQFVVVTGPSGIGKSSLVKAGLLPKLKDLALHTVLVRPERTPFATLAKALQEVSPKGVNVPDGGVLATDETALGTWIKLLPGQHEILLVIDQAEELITMSGDKVSKDYLALVAHTLREANDRLRVLLTLRSEFAPQFAESALQDWWLPDAHYNVPAMTQDELRRVIEGPAAVKVMQFESSDLVEQLVNDVVQMPGALPLLSFALSLMYANYHERHGEDRALTFADYKALRGGVAGALHVRANEVIDKLDKAQQATAKRVLERLVSVESVEYARRRVAEREFQVSDEAEQIRVNKVLERLTNARLVVTDRIEGENHRELAHDALILGWDRLLTWIKKDVSLIADLRRLTLDAAKWAEQPNQLPGILWSDPVRLDSVKKLQVQPSPGLNKMELEFARKSTQRAATVRDTRRAAVGVLVLVTASAIFYANDSNKKTEEAMVRHMNSVASATSQENLSGERAVLAIESLKIKETPEASQLLSESLASLNRAVSRFLIPGIAHSISKNGRYVSSWDENDKSVNIWTIDKNGYKKMWTASLADTNIKVILVGSAVSSNGAYLAVLVIDNRYNDLVILIFEMGQMGQGKIVAREFLLHHPDTNVHRRDYNYSAEFAFSTDDNYFLGRATRNYSIGMEGAEKGRRDHFPFFFTIGNQTKRLPLTVPSFGDNRDIIDLSLSNNSQHLALLVADKPSVPKTMKEEDFFLETERRRTPTKNEPKVTAVILKFPELAVVGKHDLNPSTTLLRFANDGRYLVYTTGDHVNIIADWAIESSQVQPEIDTAASNRLRPPGTINILEDKEGFILRDWNYASIFRVNPLFQVYSVGKILNPGRILNKGDLSEDRRVPIISISVRDSDGLIVTGDEDGYVAFYEPYHIYGSRPLDKKNVLTSQSTQIAADHIAVDSDGLYEVRNWDSITPDIRKVGPNNVWEMNLLAVSADGQKAAYWFEKTITIISVKDGKELNRVTFYNPKGILPRQVSFSPDGNEFAAIVSGWIAVWDLTKGKSIRPTATIDIDQGRTIIEHVISFDPSGNFLVTASKDLITVVNNWRTGRFQLVTSWRVQSEHMFYHWLAIDQIAVSAGGVYLAAVVSLNRNDSFGDSYNDSYVKVWRKWKRKVPEEINTLAVSSSSSKIKFHPRESVLAISDRRELQVIGVAEKKPWIRVPSEFEDVKFTEDGQTIVASGFERYAFWRWRPRDLIAEACKSMLLPEFTPADWKAYIGLADYTNPTCPKLPDFQVKQ